jgi:hypothetical protein
MAKKTTSRREPARQGLHRIQIHLMSARRDLHPMGKPGGQTFHEGFGVVVTPIAGFGGQVDYAMLIKHFGNQGTNHNPSTRYSPYIERQNLTMRMRMRRFTRLTNGFSKKLENLCHAVALHFMHYNFTFKHMTLGKPPALEAGITDHRWTVEEIIPLADQEST